MNVKSPPFFLSSSIPPFYLQTGLRGPSHCSPLLSVLIAISELQPRFIVPRLYKCAQTADVSPEIVNVERDIDDCILSGSFTLNFYLYRFNGEINLSYSDFCDRGRF